MPKVSPFKGLLYNCEKVSGNDVIAPPYDVISPEYKDLLYDKSPHNIVRIDFGKEMPGDTESTKVYSFQCHARRMDTRRYTRQG